MKVDRDRLQMIIISHRAIRIHARRKTDSATEHVKEEKENRIERDREKEREKKRAGEQKETKGSKGSVSCRRECSTVA